MTETKNENLEAQESTENEVFETTGNEVAESTDNVVAESTDNVVAESTVSEAVVTPEIEAVEASVTGTSPQASVEGEFDWDELESGIDNYSARRRSELETLYNNTLNTVQEKEVQEGTVISMNKREVVIDIGYKSDGIVSLNEFRYNPELSVGDKVDVYVENLEDPKGQMILSH